jgi:hypothetical protein
MAPGCYGLPGDLQRIADDANLLRNAHVLCIIRELRSQQERVFVICGSSHAVCLQSALADEVDTGFDATSPVLQTP